MDEFIALLKLSNIVPPLEGVYIGIKTDNKNKVSIAGMEIFRKTCK